jgi:diguanylate cyclase (GGDEF)-like protein
MDDVTNLTKQFDILDHSPIGQFVIRKDYVVIFWNRCMETWSGLSRDKIVGTDLITHFPHLSSDKYAKRIMNIFHSGPPIVFSSQLHKYFIPSPLPGGGFRIQSTFITSIPAQEDGEYYAFFAIQDETNVTAALESNKRALSQLEEEIEIRKQAEEQLVKLARYDHLTGLANRTLFRERLLMALAETHRNKTKFAVLFLDLDHFKDINDNMGHDVGDLLLKSVSERLKSRVRETDLVARMGGDEFAILLNDCKPVDAAYVSESILNILAPSHKLGSNEASVTSSIGIAMCPEASDDIENLCKFADIAMYHAKNKGKNNYQFFSSELQVQTMQHIDIGSDLQRVLEQDELRLFFQPQIDINTNVVGMEALVRWQHCKYGIIGPRQFMHMAESTGIISSISEWILYTACTKNLEWQKDFCQSMAASRISVNISLRELRHETFRDKIIEILNITELNPNHLEIELTESSIMDDTKTITALLERIHQLGIRISIDDFGTGFSSLYYLSCLPIDTVKIDLSFVQGIGKNHNDEKTIKVILNLADSLGVQTIAEGVETKEQADFLWEHKCDVMQGFYFCHPLPAEDITLFLQNK